MHRPLTLPEFKIRTLFQFLGESVKSVLAAADKIRSGGAPILWFAPALVLLLAVTLYPTALVLWLSLHRTRFYEVVGWAGLNNYVAVLSSGNFWELTFNSLTYVMGSLAIVLPLGLLSALALQSMTRGAGLIRVLLLLPWTLSMGVVGCFWLWLLNPSYGQ